MVDKKVKKGAPFIRIEVSFYPNERKVKIEGWEKLTEPLLELIPELVRVEKRVLQAAAVRAQRALEREKGAETADEAPEEDVSAGEGRSPTLPSSAEEIQALVTKEE